MTRNFLTTGCARGVLLGSSALVCVWLPASAGAAPAVASAVAPIATSAAAPATLTRPANGAAAFGTGPPSSDVHWLTNWVRRTGDHRSGAFFVVDKRAAQVHVFDADVRWMASSAVLLGAALGDDSVPGIGSRPMGLIQVHERTTPAGRFVGEPGRNLAGEDIVWVDYDAAVSMHRVRLTKPSERRAQRLASPTAADNRISYGCINVPAAFYDRHVQPVFARRHAIIYVLPDVKSVQEVLGPNAGASPAAAIGRDPGEPAK